MKKSLKPCPLRKAVGVCPLLACVLALSVVGTRAAATLQLEFKYEDSGTTTTNGGALAGGPMNLYNAADVLTDLHGAPGSGLLGGTDQALDLTSATGMGSGFTGPWGSYAFSTPSAPGASWTAISWYKTAGGTALGNSARVMLHGTDVIQMMGGAGGGAIGQAAVFAPGSPGTVNSGASTYPETGTWVFFASTYSNGVVSFYKGDAVNPVAFVSSAPFSTQAATTVNSVFWVGNRSTHSRPFDGYLDNTRFYNDGGAGDSSGALTLEELEQVRASDAAVADPVALVLTNARVAGAQFVSDVLGADATTVIQRSANLLDWSDVLLLGATNGFQDVFNPEEPTAYYRARHNESPVANADAGTLGINTALQLAAPGVLANDTDPDGGAITALLAGDVAHGSLSLAPDGSFLYTPASNYVGPDTFTYRASDGFATSGVATVTLTITNINLAPVANPESYALGKNFTLNIAAPGLLANDTDGDGDTLTAQKLTDPAHGTVTVSTNGGFTYTPATDFVGDDSFTYLASDGFTVSASATVSLAITNAANSPPLANDDFFSAMENTALVIPAGGVLTNDSDAEGTPLTALLVAGPANGALSFSANGGFTYTPNTRYFGPDSFTYRATDGMLTSAVATVSLDVAMAYSTSGSNVLSYGAPFEWRGANKMDTFGGSPSSMTPWGMDIVREPIDMLLTSTSTMQTIVNNARAAGKVTILCAMWYDNDAFSGGTTPYPDCQLLGANPTSDPRWAAVTNRWQDIANQFKGQSDVWFDLWNEPYWYDDSHGYSDTLWLSDMRLLVDNIRSKGARNICLVPGSATGQGHQVFINQGANLLAGRSNILFQIHCYQYKWNVSQATVESRFQAVLNAGCPLIVGEYGAGDPFANILSAARNKKVSTVAWLWKSSNSDNEALLRADGITPNDVSNNSLGSGVRAFCLEQRNGATGPAGPTGLSATPQSSTRINLAWSDNATGESGYTVERSTDGSTFVPIANLSANTTSYSNTGLTSGTTYYYRVIAYTPTGGSGYSNTASATTP